MLNIIKSTYFYKVVFSYLQEKTKLKFAKYNKNLQNKIDIDLNNYKFFTRKHIVYETKQKGKEYYGNEDTLYYEGEYLNGERNGKGKEYFNNSNLIYEGEFSKGKRNGKGKEYYNNKVIFDGEYLNGKRWNGKATGYYRRSDKKFFEIDYIKGKKWNGKIFDEKDDIVCEIINGNGIFKEYDKDNYISFEGEYKNGERNGKGKEYNWSGGLIFEGEYLNGERNGKGKEYFDNKIIFEGIYFNGKRWNGNGYDNNHNKIYELIDGNGHVIEFHYEEIIFEGNYLNGEKNGKGKEYDYKCNGIIIEFEGYYSNGLKNGKGKEFFNQKLYGERKEYAKYVNGQLLFEGEFLYGYILKGKNYLEGKLEFEGDYLYDKKWNGKGYDKNGDIIYELINGTGKVKEYNYIDKTLEFEGEYLNGKRNGKGKEYGHLEFIGEYLNGKRWNGKGKEHLLQGWVVECEYENGKIIKCND